MLTMVISSSHGSGHFPLRLQMTAAYIMRRTAWKVSRPETGFCDTPLKELDESIGWPPPDPDRIPRMSKSYDLSQPFVYDSTENGIDAFRKRQREDQKRWHQNDESMIRKRRPFHERYDPDADHMISVTDDESEAEDGEEGWRNSEGERLRDFGVDEETEFYDEEDVPLAELLRRTT